MSANPVLSEIERINRNEQIAEWDKNEKAIAGQLPPFSQRPLNEQESLALNPFLKWCRLNGVRHCPAKPTTVAGFISEQGYRAETLLAIERMHDIHNLPNPVTTAVVRAAVAPIIDFEPPRSWSLQEKAKFIEIPAEVREIIARRTKQRETELRRVQNELAELRKLKTNAEIKTEGSDPKSTARHVERASDAGQQSGGNAQPV